MDVMDATKLLRGGEPVVCIATRIAFHQEAEYRQRIRAARPARSAAPRISIEIVPDTAAAQETADLVPVVPATEESGE